MKCVCEKWKQIRMPDGSRKVFRPGDVGEFDECPKNFRSLAGETKEAFPIDFKTAKEQELLEAEYDLSVLKKFIEDEFGLKAGNRGKEKTVELLLDARYRKLDVDPNDMVV